jgi:hypothetical protein
VENYCLTEFVVAVWRLHDVEPTADERTLKANHPLMIQFLEQQQVSPIREVRANCLIPTAEAHVSVLALTKVLENTVAPAIPISMAGTRLAGKEEYHWMTAWSRDTALALAAITVVNISPFVDLAFDEIVHLVCLPIAALCVPG